MFPYTHEDIKEPDREALARRGLLTREQLSGFLHSKEGPAALTEISTVTRIMLGIGSWSCSAAEVIQEPFSPLCDEIHEKDSWSQLGRLQTYESAESWPQFDKEVLQLIEQLDSLDGVAVFEFKHLPSTLPIDKPRRVSDVVAALATQLEGVNQVAEHAGINSVIRGGGGHASASRAALQAYCYSVEEEVAVFAVTDYRVAFFMSRSPDVMDKRIRISDPVWWDQAKPSAKAYWLRFMRLAAERHSEKAALARELVPFTGPGKSMPVTSDMAWQLPLARLLEAKCPSTGFRTPLGILLPMASDRHKLWLSATSVDQLSRNNSETEEKLAFSYAFAQLKHNEVIERGTHAQVKEGNLLGSRIVLKLFRQDSKDAMAAFMAELNAYDDLKDLQGTYIPKLLLAGPVQETDDKTDALGDPFKEEVADLEAKLYAEEFDKYSAPRKRHKGLNGQMCHYVDSKA
ncbi:g12307 [Coccomyxa viridis]|uniref:G12307 protein n=1 Tax=Coccomyxa viridis TaxID=1274662 RepID=A0ABP1GFK6_9CHLO